MWIVLMAVVAMFTACTSRHESVTGSYGEGLLSGEVQLADGNSPAGMEVSVRGTGMTVTVGEDGSFVFAGVPENAHLDFHRALDGIETSMVVEKGSGQVIVEIAGNVAKPSSRRRAVGRGREPVYEFEGLIRSAAADNIVVFTSKSQEVTIALGPNTIIRKGDQRLTVADLLVNARVHVKATKAGEVYTALEVKLQDDDSEGSDDPPATVAEYEGLVRSASADQLVVFTSHREEITFVVTADTVIRKGSTAVLPADIQVGWRVHVKATLNADATRTATQVIVQNTNEGAGDRETELKGTVAAVAASSLTVTTDSGDVTVTVTNGTQIRLGNKKIALSQITVGNKVEVTGTSIDATTLQAKKITVED
ncbi:MAG: DUF5666 domain-containing protein [Acidobacteriota bacterium]